MIDALALLHQYQRASKTIEHGGAIVEYVEVTLDDIALANRLAHEVLGRSLDELPPQTRRVLGVLDGLVRERMQAQALVRAATGMRDTQARVHLDRLVELDYLLPHAGRNGQRFVYELAFDGDVANDATQVIGLMDVEALRSATTSRGAGANLAGGLRAAGGDLAARSRREEAPRIASADAASPLVAASALPTAPLRPTRSKPSRRNGAAQGRASDASAGCAGAASALTAEH